jgi:hypothetical protein
MPKRVEDLGKENLIFSPLEGKEGSANDFAKTTEILYQGLATSDKRAKPTEEGDKGKAVTDDDEGGEQKRDENDKADTEGV